MTVLGLMTEPVSTGGKKGKKKESKNQVVITTGHRTKNKFITNIKGLGGFGIKLADASRVLAKKFATSASVTDEDEISLQGDISQSLADFIVKQWLVRT